MYDEKKGSFDSMNPKAIFLFGLVAGLALVFLLNAFNDGGISIAKDTDSDTETSDTDTEGVKAANVQKTKSPSGTVPPVTDEDHIRGDEDALLTFIEYSDYECPFCKRFHPTMLSMMDDYEGQVKWVYRHFPLSFHDPLATAEAMAAECANELGGNDKFWEMTDLIFERTASNGNGLALGDLPKMAAELGLDEAKVKSCIDSGKFKDHILADQSGGSSAGVTGTPGSFLVDADGNAQLISGAVPYAQIKAMIDAAL
ncbi:DsbA family protein [Patescibacteria group bacterium]|nr:DsbA family protein [Patescibacteria group bacterium]